MRHGSFKSWNCLIDRCALEFVMQSQPPRDGGQPQTAAIHRFWVRRDGPRVGVGDEAADRLGRGGPPVPERGVSDRRAIEKRASYLAESRGC